MGSLHRVCAKVFMIILDIVYLGLGVALLGIGIWLRVDKRATDLRTVMDTFLGNKLSDSATWVLIAVGAVIICIAILGLLGAILELKVLLAIFIVLLLAMIALEAAACVLAGMYKDDLFSDLARRMATTIGGTYYTHEYQVWSATDEVGRPWNFLQWAFDCCGAFNYEQDYRNFMNDYKVPFPHTCCLLKDDTDPYDAHYNDTVDYNKCRAKQEGYFFSEPCFYKIIDMSEENTIIIFGLAIGVVCFTLFLLIFTVCLCVNIYKEKD